MTDEILTPHWRIAFWVFGAVLLVGGMLGVATEIWWALHGAPLAWVAAVQMLATGAAGAWVLRAARRGRVRRLRSRDRDGAG